MKLSVSLPDEDVAFLDDYAQVEGHASRSAVVHKAVQLLRTAELASEYEQAWDEWSSSGEAEVWDSTTGDGLTL